MSFFYRKLVFKLSLEENQLFVDLRANLLLDGLDSLSLLADGVLDHLVEGQVLLPHGLYEDVGDLRHIFQL